MDKLGFKKKGRHFIHPESVFFVEFPGSALIIGDEYQETYDSIKFENKSLKIMSPTQSIMDRLAAFYHWNEGFPGPGNHDCRSTAIFIEQG